MLNVELLYSFTARIQRHHHHNKSTNRNRSSKVITATKETIDVKVNEVGIQFHKIFHGKKEKKLF